MPTLRNWLARTILAVVATTAAVASPVVLGEQRGQSAGGGAAGQKDATGQKDAVTAVAGPSWLKRLGVSGTGSSLGRGAGVYGPGTSSEPAERKPIRLPVGEGVALTGADLYRINCQACHRAEGTGAPPEIKSVLNAVEGSSLARVREQLRAQGKDPSDATARATKGREDLYRRIMQGGQRMPPLAHMQRAEVDLLYGYLAELAHTPEAAPSNRRTVTWVRLGEHVVKATCHICHDAAGPRPSGKELLAGAVPPLSTFLKDRSIVEFVKKARTGAPVSMGEPAFPHRGRMPVFHYLKDEEIAAGYMYLIAYPPQAPGGRR